MEHYIDNNVRRYPRTLDEAFPWDRCEYACALEGPDGTPRAIPMGWCIAAAENLWVLSAKTLWCLHIVAADLDKLQMVLIVKKEKEGETDDSASHPQ